jgi:hypothetical protein
MHAFPGENLEDEEIERPWQKIRRAAFLSHRLSMEVYRMLAAESSLFLHETHDTEVRVLCVRAERSTFL